MSTEVLRPCLDCGKPAQGNRCELHRRSKHDAMNRPTAPNPAYDSAWRKVVRKVVTNHVLTHGWNCPGYGRAPHPATDLTGDHVVSLADGGASTAANVRILCRSCNSRKGRRSGTGQSQTGQPAVAGGGGRGSHRDSPQLPYPESSLLVA
jgi:5-methylcytosine-specific restriction protein A